MFCLHMLQVIAIALKTLFTIRTFLSLFFLSSHGIKKGANALSPYEEDTIPEFTDSALVSVFYGSTIALQMSDGRFMSVEEDTGKVSCRHWPDVEERGIRQQSSHPNDPRSVPARCLLTLTNLKDVNSSDPIHYGDSVYLVLS